jgi:16S rRNA (guanine527-N7)-methyltransferase
VIEAAVIREGARALGVELTSSQVDRLAGFGELLVRWNATFNLVSKADIPRLVPRHLLDSLSLTPFLTGNRVLDVGSGAGLPGLPLAIAVPERRVVLLDRSERKLRFARQAIIELALTNVEVRVASIETFDPGEDFDVIVARAVCEPARLWTASARLLAPGGRALILCRDPAQVSPPAGALLDSVRVEIPGLDVPHWILRLRAAAEAA